jgi:hypothetical protein
MVQGRSDPELLRQQQQRAHEMTIRAGERTHDINKEYELTLLNAATRDAQEAMKVALAINGGAAIAVLAFMSTKNPDILAKLFPIFCSLFWFAGGVIFAALTAGCAYLSNSLYAVSYRAQRRTFEYPFVEETDLSKSREKLATGFALAGIILAILALLAFVGGLVFIWLGLRNLPLVS